MAPLIILAGPTASGKSETAVALAERLDTEIINADSMQVYKYFDIGTAKPSREARQKVVHHLIDILEPDEDFTAFDFKVRALERIRALVRGNKVPILVGGTGLYLKVLALDYDCAVQVSPEIRERIKADIRRRGTESLHAELAGVDASSAARIQPTDPLRIERALGVYYQTGRRFSDFHATEAPAERGFDMHYFALERDRKQLYADIDRRVDDMMRQGLLDEVKQLRSFGKDLKPFQSIGYAQMMNHLEGKISLDRAVYEIKRDTRHYAKRQITWFKKVPGARSIPVDTGDTPLSLRDKIMALLPPCLPVLFFLFVSGGLASAGMLTYEEGLKFFARGDYPKAMNHFQVIRKSVPDTRESKRALYLVGKAYAAMQEHENAVETFNAALAEYPEIEDYIRFDLAKSHFSLQEYAQALEQATYLLEKFPRSCLAPQAELLRADALGQLDKSDQAIHFLAQAIGRFPQKPRDPGSYLPQFIFKSIGLMEAAHQSQQAYALYRELYISYPDHPLTGKARAMLARAEPPLLSEEEFFTRIQNLMSAVQYAQAIEEMNQFKRQAGKAAGSPRLYFYQASAYKGLRQRAQANEVLLSFLKDYPQHQRVAEARYLVARNYWNLNQNENGIRYFQEIGESEWFAKAQFYLGRLYEDEKQYPLAIQQYDRVANLPTDHEYKETAAWRLAWVYYKTGRYDQSFDRFRHNMERFPNGQLADSNMFWMSKSAERMGKEEAARKIYEDLYRAFPFTYYGLRAKDRLNDEKVTIEPPAADDDAPAANDAEDPFHYGRAVEMVAMGLNENARLEIRQVEKSVKKNLTGVIRMANLYNRAKAYAESFRLLTLYKDLKTARGEKDLPLRFWKSLYPAAYSDSIHRNSQNRRIDPFLVKGVIHQESMFDANSLSPAGARGLMQLMPETGRRLSSEEQMPFTADALFDPEVNIQLGVKYLSELIRQTGNNAAHVLICYNAGPDTLKRWLKQFEGIKDPDEFLESIPFQETRIYVRRVLRNYGIYRYLYPNGAEDRRRDDLF